MDEHRDRSELRTRSQAVVGVDEEWCMGQRKDWGKLNQGHREEEWARGLDSDRQDPRHNGLAAQVEGL